MKLTCDICGGDLQMAPGGQGAACTVCGVTYDIGRLREKLGASAPQQQPAQAPIQQVPQQAPQPMATAPAPASDTVHYLHIKRLFDLHLSKYAAVIDGKDRYIIGGVGKVSSIPLTPGPHVLTIEVAATHGISEIGPYNFTVTDCDWAAEVKLKRGAFSAKYELKIWEMRE